MARMLADGPGRDYMRWACAHPESNGGKPYARVPFPRPTSASTPTSVRDLT
ncbi:MAG: hypothetical protein WDN45_01135 [Caulobacteraceae bacterium]